MDIVEFYEKNHYLMIRMTFFEPVNPGSLADNSTD